MVIKGSKLWGQTADRQTLLHSINNEVSLGIQ